MGTNSDHTCERRKTEKAGTSWCERGDSNPHGFTRQILSLVRLPIPPLSLLFSAAYMKHSVAGQMKGAKELRCNFLSVSVIASIALVLFRKPAISPSILPLAAKWNRRR